MSTRFLGMWVVIFGTLLLPAGAALQVWALTDSDLRERRIAYAAILVVGASALCTLGRACHPLARFGDREQELGRCEPADVPIDNGGKG